VRAVCGRAANRDRPVGSFLVGGVVVKARLVSDRGPVAEVLRVLRVGFLARVVPVQRLVPILPGIVKEIPEDWVRDDVTNADSPPPRHSFSMTKPPELGKREESRHRM
jgi:hypothetical protein